MSLRVCVRRLPTAASTDPAFRTRGRARDPDTSIYAFLARRDMEMWKLLTQKFKAQSLNEVQPFRREEVEDHDSGTESDEENAELQAIEEAAMQSKRDQENYKPQVQPSLAHFTMTSSAGYHHQSPMQSSASPISSMSKRPFQLVNQSNVCFQPLSHHRHPHHHHHPAGCGQYYNTHLDRESPAGSSDYERCSLDYEPSSSAEFDRHSSEDELTIINCTNHELHPEKRKWSQVNRCNSCDDSSGSSDEELRDLFGEPKPLNFSSSPPKGVPKLGQTLPPPPPAPLFLANLSPKTVRLCSVSPRKRHRQTNSSDVSDATVIQRPCLDFEKMQVSTRFFTILGAADVAFLVLLGPFVSCRVCVCVCVCVCVMPELDELYHDV
ncbi:hypothetical protein LSH36_126g04005 [Paralvinella palmiformis]|uniref:Uncharacterized protein n=1 Tax=Paralvinella palmiformis TaxID=53620 RepID=A0AAD9JWV1_9ANNE|nr:hypothetical protein LSH36_126g04005 [Paralvinella palmiformis]